MTEISNEQLYEILHNEPELGMIEGYLPQGTYRKLHDFQVQAGNAQAGLRDNPTVEEAQEVFGEAYMALDHAPDAQRKLQAIMKKIGLTPSAPDKWQAGGQGIA